MIIDTTLAKSVAEQLLCIRAVTINTKNPYRYVSGILAPLYTDNRLLISHPKEWKVIIEAYISAIKMLKKQPHVLSGTATAAIPHAAVLSDRLDIPMVYVRSAKKEHGKENLIEGELKAGDSVLIIEDLVSTGKSITGNVEAIRSAGGVVDTCIAITTSNLNAYTETIQSLGISLVTLTSIEVVIATAVEKSCISEAEKEIVDSFLQSPKTWGKDFGFE
jgi:orotate phosphoribosyltransferase